MPKLKTNKAAKKRFKITATGKALILQTGRRHLLSDKRSRKKRRLRRWVVIDSRDRHALRALLPYGA